jgi:tetratricopeptide (TPR) repeat protein
MNPIVPILLLTKSKLEYVDAADQSRRDLLQAVEMAKGMMPRTMTNTLVLSQATWMLGQYRDSQGDAVAAEQSTRASVDALRELAKQQPGAMTTTFVALREADLARMQLTHQNLADAEDTIADVIALERGNPRDSVELQGQFSEHLLLRAQVQQARGKWQEALASIEEGLKLERGVSRSDRRADVVVADLLIARAASENKLGRPDIARSDIDDALTLLDGLAQLNIPDTRTEMADVLTTICRPTDAGATELERCQKGIMIWRRIADAPPERFEVASLLVDEANLEIALNKPRDAVATLTEALRIGREAAGEDPRYAPDIADFEIGLGDLLAQQGDASGYETHLKAGLGALGKAPSDGPAAARRAVILARLAEFYLDGGKYDDAIGAGKDALETWSRVKPRDIAPYGTDLANVQSDLGEACYLSHQDCARSALEDAARGFAEATTKQVDIDQSRHCRALRTLGLIDMNDRQAEKAVTHLRDALAICKALASHDPRFRPNVQLVSTDLRKAEQAAARTKRGAKPPPSSTH